MDLPLRVTVTPDRATASAGEPLVFAVSVRNVGDTVEHYALDVLGLPDGATAHCEPEVAKLRPQEGADLTVRITIPELAPAGSYVLGLLVKSKYTDQVSRCVELPVEVAVVNVMTVQAAPEVALGGSSGTFAVDLTNNGNAALHVRLTATDPERRVSARFAPDTVELAPGGRTQSVLTVQAPVPWGKEKNQPLTIEATAEGAGSGPVVVMGQGSAAFVQRPRIASRLTRVIGIAAAVLLIAAAIATPPLIAELTKETAAPPPPATTGAPTANVVVSAPSVPSGPTSAPSSAITVPPSTPQVSESSTGLKPEKPPEKTVILTSPGGVPANGRVDTDAFSGEGLMVVSGDPGADAPPGCENAKAIAVVPDAVGVPVLVPAHPDDTTLCHVLPLMVKFPPDDPAASLTVIPAVEGALRMQVIWQGQSPQERPDLTVPADAAGRGIDYILLLPAEPPPAGTPADVAVREIRYVSRG